MSISIKDALSYNPETGAFIWKIQCSSRFHIGDRAGTIHERGHRVIAYKGKHYVSGRLAFYFMNGVYPNTTVWHLDMDKTNDAWDNLCLVPRELVKTLLVKPYTNSKTGIRGVYWCNNRKKWHASIYYKGENILSVFEDSIDEAVEKVTQKRNELIEAFRRGIVCV